MLGALLSSRSESRLQAARALSGLGERLPSVLGSTGDSEIAPLCAGKHQSSDQLPNERGFICLVGTEVLFSLQLLLFL